MEKLDPQQLPALIRDLQAERRAPGSPRLPEQTRLQELARKRIEAPLEILDWAMRDRRWSFTLAEMMAGAVGRPRELAARLVVAIVDELEEEDELLAADAGTT